jgi:hypothetical protein
MDDPLIMETNTRELYKSDTMISDDTSKILSEIYRRDEIKALAFKEPNHAEKVISNILKT